MRREKWGGSVYVETCRRRGARHAKHLWLLSHFSFTVFFGDCPQGLTVSQDGKYSVFCVYLPSDRWNISGWRKEKVNAAHITVQSTLKISHPHWEGAVIGYYHRELRVNLIRPSVHLFAHCFSLLIDTDCMSGKINEWESLPLRTVKNCSHHKCHKKDHDGSSTLGCRVEGRPEMVSWKTVCLSWFLKNWVGFFSPNGKGKGGCSHWKEKPKPGKEHASFQNMRRVGGRTQNTKASIIMLRWRWCSLPKTVAMGLVERLKW